MARWVIEEEVFGEDALTQRARARGLEVLAWRDAWWEAPPALSGPTI